MSMIRKLLKPILLPILRPLAETIHARIVEVSPRYAGHFTFPLGGFEAAIFLRYEQIEGDYLEFGVFQGNSFVNTIKLLESSEKIKVESSDQSPETVIPLKRRYFAFDSFQGLPSGDERFRKGNYSNPKDQFIRTLKENGCYSDRVVLVEGWYERTCVPATATEHKIEKVAWAYFDCDLYESTVSALNFITPFLQTGTVLSFNDWWCYKGFSQRGEQRAVGEWLATNPHIKLKDFVRWGYNDVVFIVELAR